MDDFYRTKTTLYVEGRDDFYVVIELLKRHGFNMDAQPRDVELHEAVLDIAGFGRTNLLDLVPTVVKTSTDRAVGFIVDADASTVGTWKAICDRIEKAAGASVQLPEDCPPDGAVADIPTLRGRVGIWIMPDNARPGLLEDFLQQLIRDGDSLLPLAQSSTTEAKKAGAAFKASSESKAVAHTWLAWQEEPGCPFGTAIKARYFDHNSASAQRFINWVRRLIR